MTLIVVGSLLFLVGSLLFFIQVSLKGNSSTSNLNLMPLESGFESLKMSVFMSTPFLFLAVLFVLFDLELILLFPGVVLICNSSLLCFLWVLTISFVLVTLLLEWLWSGFKWQI